ncbi:hypothetical protein [Rhizobium rhizogenes]|uniref:hypothetical protein n=1 Tax=Rhizobium rhizogenes TaxID=359 RepID=UPI00227091D1|nr:hypothetical protein [Rhizobium rhizogenes]
MNAMEIANLFIKAAIVDRRLPIQARPARLKGSWVPFVHTEEDVKSRIRTNLTFGQFKENLHPDEDPFNEWLFNMFDEDNQRLKPEDIADWERANELITLVSDEGNRRALLHWALSKADNIFVTRSAKKRKTRKGQFGTVGMPSGKTSKGTFASWCRAEGIHEMTGSRRKDRAIAIIEQQLIRGISPNTETEGFGVLPVGPVFEHIADTVAADAPNRKDRFVERDADTVFCKEGTVFNWREMRKAEAHRKADLRKRQAA